MSLAGVWAQTLCAPEGTRTPNLLIRSQMLYPLSYGRSALADAEVRLPVDRGPDYRAKEASAMPAR